jgi:hypothetical protein
VRARPGVGARRECAALARIAETLETYLGRDAGRRVLERAQELFTPERDDAGWPS